MRLDLTRAILRLMHVNTVLRDYFLEFGEDVHVDANKALLRASEVAKYLYLIQSGAVRLCVRNAEGAETTVQFFFEDDMVCSLESMLSGCPRETLINGPTSEVAGEMASNFLDDEANRRSIQ
ncbi:cyclic nucleotide-binding domain-containing protein [Burkholderia cenocepacia]